MRVKAFIKKMLQSGGVLKLYNVLNPRNKLHVGKENVFIFEGAQLNGVSIKIRGKNNSVVFKKGSVFNSCVLRIFGDNNNIVVEENCLLNSGKFWIEDNCGSIWIGDGTTVHGATDFSVIEGTSITVGKDCMFSSNITLRTGDSHSIIDECGNRTNPSESIVIGDHVWFGANVTCLKGTSVPNNTILGTGSLVNKKFEEEGTVIAGCPANIVKEHIGWLRERI